MEVKQGFYVKQFDETLDDYNYFLILEIENKNIKVAKHRGTPMDTVIIDYDDLTSDGYIITILSEKEVTVITKYDTYLKNGIPSSHPVAIQYRWSDKEYTIQLNPKYWNGSNWADIPEGFYKCDKI